ncbi:MAG: glycosyltransferase [bacterium]|nr:glycosyltransferase [bacterium]MCP4966597.1 glycosyltransferase [bacterium]
MKVLFATAELTPMARVGGLAEAAAGLVVALRAAGITVDLILPDYSETELTDERPRDVTVPKWARPATARRGVAAGVGDVTLVKVPGIVRSHPYIDETGIGWPDNDARFFAFSAAVANLTQTSRPDVVHLNDWHTAATLAFLRKRPPVVFTIHTLGYQGWAGSEWLPRIPYNFSAFESFGDVNPLAGAIQVADRVIAVSPNYADEIRRPESGMGLDHILSGLGDHLVGIRNGIDTAIWDPATDQRLSANYSLADLSGKESSRAALHKEAGWTDDGTPLVGMVTRLVEQKGIDLALESVRYAAGVPYRLVMLGSGEQRLSEWAHWASGNWPDNMFFADGYNQQLAHTIFAGSDLLLMPSRFEPCGLAQMQAMAYGTIPVVTDVGGLHDTVIDADADRKNGTGFLATTAEVPGIVDVLHRAGRAWRHKQRRGAIQRRGMARDWSWQRPAQRHIDLYEELLAL